MAGMSPMVAASLIQGLSTALPSMIKTMMDAQIAMIQAAPPLISAVTKAQVQSRKANVKIASQPPRARGPETGDFAVLPAVGVAAALGVAALTYKAITDASEAAREVADAPRKTIDDITKIPGRVTRDVTRAVGDVVRPFAPGFALESPAKVLADRLNSVPDAAEKVSEDVAQVASDLGRAAGNIYEAVLTAPTRAVASFNPGYDRVL